jgi:phage recombination protein Bet
MNALVKTEIPALQMAEAELVSVMQNSVYPGAKLESIKLALGYCKAQNLDPMTKPVHIVPMSVKVKAEGTEKKDKYIERDVIMPGIGLYRVQAARSGEYGGISEPIFGPTQKLKYTDERWEDNENGQGRSKRTSEGEIDYPEWCRVTVKRIVGDRVVEFTATEYWIENYATSSRYSSAPNAMWKKRPRGQLAKCTEAQALRKAFPEIGAAPTAEEMEGKTIDDTGGLEPGTQVVSHVPGPQSKSAPPAPAREAIEGEARREPEQPPEDAGEATSEKREDPNADKPMLEGQLKIIKAKLARAALTEMDLCAKYGVKSIDELKWGQFQAIQDWIAEKAAKVAG